MNVTRHYEVVFIMTPVLSDSQIKETIEKFKDVLVKNGAEVYHEEHWGLKKFATPIKGKSSGYYHLFEYKANPKTVLTFDVELRRDERIIRYLNVTLDKYGVKFNEDRRNGKFVKKEKVEKPIIEIDKDE
ncbi:MAG: 30S ribosomal protein S6 [Cytophagales bacterium]|nr:30S ribosomal protein S6 [Cytophagales bacterium]MDW8384283.1 30S ribosomal protein S6 [Flammeovirgaceae bacterium]